ncbi:hypothetical protein G6F35_017722 [Rhizopus arrhizus]|nr:hypothetical protein G6F35_017722 [Rhizopus arrhizus]
MHKSKGLQFETVILYGLHRAPRGDQAPLVRFEQSGGRVLFGPVKPRAETEADPVSRYLGAREARRASYEIDRLLYVAATRARKHQDPARGQPPGPPVALPGNAGAAVIARRSRTRRRRRPGVAG